MQSCRARADNLLYTQVIFKEPLNESAASTKTACGKCSMFRFPFDSDCDISIIKYLQTIFPFSLALSVLVVSAGHVSSSMFSTERLESNSSSVFLLLLLLLLVCSSS